MKTLHQSHLILIGALAVAGAAYAQQPNDVVIRSARGHAPSGEACYSGSQSSVSWMTSPARRPVRASNRRIA
jgi:hypothetical protein